MTADAEAPTLTAWLLEQIEADEAWVRGHAEDFDDCQECAFTERPVSPYSSARLLAECAAKRKIVELASRMHVRENGEWVLAHESYLRALASVYADRPGWREEWR